MQIQNEVTMIFANQDQPQKYSEQSVHVVSGEWMNINTNDTNL